MALWVDPGLKSWAGPYLQGTISDDALSDRWGNHYFYRYQGTHGDKREIVSYGADGRPGGTGPNEDTVSWGR